jgi:hypothetical protein
VRGRMPRLEALRDGDSLLLGRHFARALAENKFACYMWEGYITALLACFQLLEH